MGGDADDSSAAETSGSGNDSSAAEAGSAAARLQRPVVLLISASCSNEAI